MEPGLRRPGGDVEQSRPRPRGAGRGSSAGRSRPAGRGRCRSSSRPSRSRSAIVRGGVRGSGRLLGRASRAARRGSGAVACGEPVAGTHRQTMEPGIPRARVAERAHVPPSQHERVLDRVLGGSESRRMRWAAPYSRGKDAVASSAKASSSPTIARSTSARCIAAATVARDPCPRSHMVGGSDAPQVFPDRPPGASWRLERPRGPATRSARSSYSSQSPSRLFRPTSVHGTSPMRVIVVTAHDEVAHRRPGFVLGRGRVVVFQFGFPNIRAVPRLTPA